MADLNLKIVRNGQGLKDIEVVLANRGKGITDAEGRIAFIAPAIGDYWLPCYLRGTNWAMGTTLLINTENECEIEV